MGSALDAKVSGSSWGPLPQQGQHNSPRGILQWKDQTKPILAESVFNKCKGLRRRITPREIARVFNYPEERIQNMTEDQLYLLTTNEEIPGKIFYSALFSISTLESSLNVTNQPKYQDSNQLFTRGLNFSKYESKWSIPINLTQSQRDWEVNPAGPLCVPKNTKILSHGYSKKGLTQDLGLLRHKVKKNNFIEFIESTNDFDKDLQTKWNIDEEESKEGEPSAKAVKSDNAKVPVHLWNGCIAKLLINVGTKRSRWEGK